MLLVREADIDYACRGPVQGFKVILHPPNELADISGQHFRVPFDEAVRISIKPNVLVTSTSLNNYSPERRQCYFNAERKLRYFKAYTQRNCYLECVANMSLEICGCVRFSIPHDDDTPVCGVQNIVCYMYIDDMLSRHGGLMQNPMEKCHCLPACTSISYDAEMYPSKYEMRQYVTALNESLSQFDG